MNVRIPHDVPNEDVTKLKQTEKQRALDLQKSGKWRHLWRVSGLYANVSIFDVSGPDELHELLSTLPLFPFMDIEVQALCPHPSALSENG
jgi:muconolactone D-isomerase